MSDHHPKRRSPRLQGYDYRQSGAYFVTICTHDRSWLFGEVSNGVMRLNAFGKIAEAEWYRTGERRSNIALDTFVVMPYHVHAIILLSDPFVGTGRALSDHDTKPPDAQRTTPALSLPPNHITHRKLW